MRPKIIEEEKIKESNPVVIIGFPDIGLVGTIALSHIIDELNLKERGYVESVDLPPITVVHGKRVKPPIRIYSNDGVIAVISEIPVPPSEVQPLSETLAEWFKEKNPSLLTILGGIVNPKRMEIEKPGVYGVPAGKDQEKLLKDNDVTLFEEGFLAGQDGVILRQCVEKKVPSLYLMAESHYGFPDPGAAASVIQAMNRVLGMDINVKKLLEKADEIRLLSRELMKRTQQNLAAMQKPKEQERPIMYG